ncbi:MAG: hypothetical protein ACQERD_00970 [Campylobacterota bacterium]
MGLIQTTNSSGITVTMEFPEHGDEFGVTNIDNSDYESKLNTSYYANELSKIDGINVLKNTDGSIAVSSDTIPQQDITDETYQLPIANNDNTASNLIDINNDLNNKEYLCYQH